VTVLPEVLRQALARAGAPPSVCDYFPIWSSEIGPDFWTFCESGLASAAAIQEILALRPDMVLHVSGSDPHPPPYLRVLLVFECCRQVWGRGPWDLWDNRWRELYDPADATPSAALLLKGALPYLPVVARALLTTRFRVLEGRTLPDLFDLAALAPARLAPFVHRRDSEALPALPAGVHLAVFRLASEQGRLTGLRLDAAMTSWLIALGQSPGATSATMRTSARSRPRLPLPKDIRTMDAPGTRPH